MLLQVLGEPLKSRHSDLLQVLGENFHPIKFQIQKAIASFGGRFLPHQIPDSKSYCKFWGGIFTPSNSWFKKLLQVLGGNFHPIKFQIQKAIASFGEPVKSTVLRLLQVLGEDFHPIKFLI